MHIFLIGPASVGKTTVGKVLAEALKLEFVDIDLEFCNRIESIGDYIRNAGYPAYCEANSKLVEQLLSEKTECTVFATPSGFLVHEHAPQLIEKHLRLIEQHTSVLLLPAKDPGSVVDVIVSRQTERYGDAVDPEDQRARFLDRFEKYRNYGDVKIFSMESPDAIVQKILLELEEKGLLPIR